MHRNKDDQTYMDSIRTVIETVLTYSDSDKKEEKLTGDPWEVEKCFKMMLSMAGFISYKLAKIDNEAFTMDESVTNIEPESAFNNSQAFEVSESKCDYSFDELNVKEEQFETEYPIDNIFKDLNSIFDSTIFDQVGQVEDNFDTTFVVHQDDDIEKLLTDVERCVEIIPDAKTKQSSIRKFRLKSSVEKSELRVIRCEKCSFETTNIRCIHKHMREKHSDLEYSCPFCEYRTDQKRHFKSHLNRQHPTKNCKFTTLINTT